MAARSDVTCRVSTGTFQLLLGMIMGVLAYSLFAQTMLNIGPIVGDDLGIEANLMNIAVSITALFCGIFMVVIGGLSDRLGRVRTIQVGLVISMVGSLIIGTVTAGSAAGILMMTGRILQGLGAAFVMPASLALVREYWNDDERPRAISLWSMGSWGGAAFASLVGGIMAETVGWRWIFFTAAAFCLVALYLIRGTPESKAASTKAYQFDTWGVISFLVMMVALQVLLTQGGRIGWVSVASVSLAIVGVVAGYIFFRVERSSSHAFVNFSLFKNMMFTGATLSNFLLNGTIGIIVVSMSLMQLGAGSTALEAGLLTIGYGAAIVIFIPSGERLLKRFGHRIPMLTGAVIVGAAIVLLMQTWVTEETYRTLAIVAFTLFGLGLAFYATPSTDAALSSLPADQSGSGSGIYKMASSLGASFGIALSSTVFTIMNSNEDSTQLTEGLISWAGRQDNVVTREAALVALSLNLVILVLAFLSIWFTIPRRKPESQ